MTITYKLIYSLSSYGPEQSEIEKNALEMADDTAPDILATQLFKIAEQYPLCTLEWAIEKNGKTISGTFSNDNCEDSLSLLEADIRELSDD